MYLLFSDGSLLIRSLGWTLLHSLWQGALVSACAFILLKALPHARARIRYHILLSSFLALAGWFAATWAQQWQRLQSVTVQITAAARETGIEKVYTISTVPPQGRAEQWMHRLLPHMEHAFPWLVGLYIAGICLMVLRFGAGLGRMFRIRYRNVLLPDASWQERLRQLQARLGIVREVRLYFSARVDMPMMLGALKPVILLPVATMARLDMAQTEAILLHELAHIRRQDYLVNMLQIVVETVLFFNPFMWWISAGIRREREHCCDDLVLSQTLQPLPYATALAVLEASRSTPVPALAAGGQKHYLFNRIKRMTEMKKHPLNYGRVAAAVVIAGLLTCSVIWLTPSFAQGKRESRTSAGPRTAGPRIVIIDDNGNRKEYRSVEELPAEERHRLRESLQHASGEQSSAGEDGDMAAAMPPPPPPPPPYAAEAPEPPAVPEPPVMDYGSAVREALASVDWKQIDHDTRDALKEADKALAAAGREVDHAMKDIDWKQIDRQVRDAMKEVDAVDWNKVSEAAGRGMDGARMKKEIQDQVEEALAARQGAQEAARAGREEAVRAGREARLAAEVGRRNSYMIAEKARREAMKSAREAMRASEVARRESFAVAEKARVEAVRAGALAARDAAGAHTGNRYENMLREMEADGLIDREQGFEIDKNSADLRINGKDQPDAVKVKYRRYFTPGKVQIRGARNRLSISARTES